MTDLLRIAAAARVFTLAVIASTALVGDVELAGLWYVAAIAVAAESLSVTRRVPDKAIVLLEGALTGVVAVWAYPAHQAALPYLAIPVLVAGIAGGVRWVGTALAAEAASMVVAGLLLVDGYDAHLAGAMVQADAFGIPVGQVLRVQSSEIRVKRRQWAEEAAQKVPVKILVPLIFCILPCLFIAVLGPAGISIMNNFKGTLT